MANPLMLFTDVSTIVYSGSKTATSSNPFTKLNDFEPSSSYVGSSVSASQTVVIDFGTATYVDTMVFDNHNFYTILSRGLNVHGADNWAFTTNAVTAASNMLAPSNSTYTMKLTTPATKRYWRIQFQEDNDLAAAPQIGNWFAGNAIEFTTPYDFGYKTENASYETVEKYALDGSIRTSQVFDGRLKYELKFSLQNDTLKTDFQSFYRSVRGKMYPFYFTDTDGVTTRYMHFTDDYVPVSQRRYNLTDIATVNMRTHVAEY